MSDQLSQLDEHAIMRLAQMREQIGAALTEFRTDPILYRVFNNVAGVLDDRLGRSRELPRRRDRRQGR